MDHADRAIVAELRRDGRISNKTLAQRVGLAPSTTLNRVRALEHTGVITGYRAVISNSELGMGIEALVFLRIRPKHDAAIRRFVDAVWAMPTTVGLYLITGSDDAIVHVAVPTTETLRTTVLEKLGRIDGVVDERTSLIFEHRSR